MYRPPGWVSTLHPGAEMAAALSRRSEGNRRASVRKPSAVRGPVLRPWQSESELPRQDAATSFARSAGRSAAGRNGSMRRCIQAPIPRPPRDRASGVATDNTRYRCSLPSRARARSAHSVALSGPSAGSRGHPPAGIPRILAEEGIDRVPGGLAPGCGAQFLPTLLAHPTRAAGNVSRCGAPGPPGARSCTGSRGTARPAAEGDRHAGPEVSRVLDSSLSPRPEPRGGRSRAGLHARGCGEGRLTLCRGLGAPAPQDQRAPSAPQLTSARGSIPRK